MTRGPCKQPSNDKNVVWCDLSAGHHQVLPAQALATVEESDLVSSVILSDLSGLQRPVTLAKETWTVE